MKKRKKKMVVLSASLSGRRRRRRMHRRSSLRHKHLASNWIGLSYKPISTLSLIKNKLSSKLLFGPPPHMLTKAPKFLNLDLKIIPNHLKDQKYLQIIRNVITEFVSSTKS
jgi:hypothetical protein